MLQKFIQSALLLVVLFTTVQSYAQVSQAPDGIQFQALATDANGHPAAGRVIYVKDAIIAKTATGTIVYSETFKVTASSAGIFTIVLGKGTYASGVSSIANIDWANGPFFLNLKIAVEPTVPTSSWNVNNEYVDLGTSQFWSVPYAMYAGSVKGLDTKLNIADTAAMLKPYFTAINLKANIESPTFTGTVSGITKAMVGLANVDNTSDLNKPISTATQTALDLKANAADITAALNLKANTADVNTALALKANTADVNTALALKANASDVTTALALKANTADVTTALNLKANTSDVTTGLATKVDKITGKELSTNDYTTAEKTKLAAITGTNTGDQDLSAFATNTALALKANTADVTTALNLKANVTDVTNSLATKVDKVTGKTLSTNDYTTAEKSKLAAITGTNTGDQDLSALATNTALALKANTTDVTTALNLKANTTDVNNSLALKANTSSLSTVATSGSYNDLSNKPTIPSAYTLPTASASVLGGVKVGSNLSVDGNGVLSANINAGSISGTVTVANGGTGATSLTGLVKGNGTNALTAAVAGTDYQAPLTLTTTGTGAATFSGTTLNIPLVSSTVDAGSISGTVTVAKGGTGATTLTGLVKGNGTNALTAAVAGTDYQAPLTLTTTGTGAATFSGTTLNIPLVSSTVDAGSISGTVTVANGGTGATSLTGLVKGNGTNALTAAVAGTDYQAPLTLTTTGTGAATFSGTTLTIPTYSLPIADGTNLGGVKVGSNLNVDANGVLTANINAGTLTGTTLAANVVNSSLTSVGTVTSGTISLTTDITTSGTLKAGAVTYPNIHGTNGQVLTTTGSGTLSWTSIPTPDLTNYVTTNTAQTITGAKTFSETTTFSKDLSVNGITVGKGRGNESTNTAIGFNALSANTPGELLIGSSLAFRGVNNTASGYGALSANTTGFYNTATGSNALKSNIAGFNNTAIGYNALEKNTNSSNTAIGSGALQNNTSGNYNTATGVDALKSNTEGVNNTAYGSSTLLSNTTGTGNTAIGFTALFSNLTDGNSKGDNNTAIGIGALKWNTTGSNNTASGKSALIENTTGSYNAAIGHDAGRYLANGSTDNTTSDYSVYLGSNTKASADNAQNEIVIGYNAIGSGSNTIQLGNTAVTNVNTSGTLTAGTVTYPRTHGTNGQVLTTTGSGTLSWTSIPTPDLTNYVTTNTAQTITGAKTFSETTTFSKDLAVNGITVGKGAGNKAFNTAIGVSALPVNTNGNNNTAIGAGALFSNTTGGANIAIGVEALASNSTGLSNTAIGGAALGFNSTGSSNTAIGSVALITNSTGEFNTAIGYGANVASGTLSNTTAIGNGAIVSTSNTIQLGNTSVTNVNTSGTITAAGIGLGVSAPNASAILEASSTTQGFLPPRLTTTQRDAIASPAEGLTLWNTDNKQLEVFDGSYWKNMVGLLVSPLNIGDTYGGGKVFYIFGPSDNGYIKGQTHGLIAAPEDQTTDAGIKWFPDKFYGATGTYIGLGLPNTLAIITSAVVTGTTNMSSFAAGLANSYRGGGNIDWYLPSIDELKKMYENKAAIGNFATTGIPGYWSSTQKGGISFNNFTSFANGVENARLQFFFTGGSPSQPAGTVTDTGISNLRRVRAIRVF